MIDFATVAIELQNARAVRINAELACCEIEELTDAIRSAHMAFMQVMAKRRFGQLNPVATEG